MEPCLPTLYQYYSSEGVMSGLSDNQTYFTLNEKNITLYSGSMHYFRTHPDHWRDRLRKMRAAGLNSIETYIPWNLHQPQHDVFDFGSGGSDFEPFLNIKKFFRIVQEEDLFAIVRPGPYICSEWEFGGFPSWLLRNSKVQLRTSEPTYIAYVRRYFAALLPILAALQFTVGGPIIAFQIENEYGSTERRGSFKPDRKYLRILRDMMLNHGIKELLFTSDSPTLHGDVGTLPGELLQTANFASDPTKEFNKLRSLQPHKPVMAMEFWTGWFDHWGETHHQRSSEDFSSVLYGILNYSASVNMYMFSGGTNWGFLNGANLLNSRSDNSGYAPDVTSYDYDAPLTEAGDYTIKYVLTKSLIQTATTIKTQLPRTPSVSHKSQYEPLTITSQLLLDEIVKQVPETQMHSLTLHMEHLDINQGCGQSYGFLLYRRSQLFIPAMAKLTIQGYIRDTVTVLLNGFPLNKPLAYNTDLNGFGYWRQYNSSIMLSQEDIQNATLDLLVENMGRVNFGYLEQFQQFKGLAPGSVLLNGLVLEQWQMIPLEFRSSWSENLNGWHIPVQMWWPGPSLYLTELHLNDSECCHDTFINMQHWTKGIVIVNGFVLGRYLSAIGPQQTLYLPGPLLRRGSNNIMIFEFFIPNGNLTFSKKHLYKRSFD